MENSRQQVETIDYLKAVAIIMVIVHHCLAYLSSIANGISRVGELSIVLLHTSHVPLFCIIAGYLCHKQPVGKYYGKKVQRIIIPFITFSLLKLVYSIFISSDFAHGGSSIGEWFLFSFLVGTQYWFAYAIFDLFLVAPLFWIRGGWKMSRGLLALIVSYTIVVIVSVTGMELPEWFQIKEAVYYLPYFAFGCWLAQDKEPIAHCVKYKRVPLLIISVLIVVGFTIIFIFNQKIRIHPVRFFVAIAIAYLLYELVKYFPKHLRFLNLIAKYSLQIVATGCNRTPDRHSRENRPLKKEFRPMASKFKTSA